MHRTRDYPRVYRSSRDGNVPAFCLYPFSSKGLQRFCDSLESLCFENVSSGCDRNHDSIDRTPKEMAKALEISGIPTQRS